MGFGNAYAPVHAKRDAARSHPPVLYSIAASKSSLKKLKINYFISGIQIWAARINTFPGPNSDRQGAYFFPLDHRGFEM